jgi:antitoxin (DNA-binding transcriptional repressor) of toxin-antitoxin stability system
MKTRISATKAARSFSDIVNRVRYRGESFVVERRGQPLCEIVPVRPAKSTVGDFVRLLRSIPKPDKEYLDIVEDLVRNQPRVAPSPWER